MPRTTRAPKDFKPQQAAMELGLPTDKLVEPGDVYCPHAVSMRSGGWTFDPDTALWVHSDPDCRKPSRPYAEVTEQPAPVLPAFARYPVDPSAPVLLALDPGDRHVGVALFGRNDELDRGWECYWAGEMTPDGLADMVAVMTVLGLLHTIVFERFLLYGDRAAEQTGSEFETAQLIGTVKWLARQANTHAQRHIRYERGVGRRPLCMGVEHDGEEYDRTCEGYRSITVVGQLAAIKEAAFKLLRRMGIKSTAKRLGLDPDGHALDAEAHGWYWLLRGNVKFIEVEPEGRTARPISDRRTYPRTVENQRAAFERRKARQATAVVD